MKPKRPNTLVALTLLPSALLTACNPSVPDLAHNVQARVAAAPASGAIKWNSRGPFTGIVHKSQFENCCIAGQSHMSTYYVLHLDNPIDIEAKVGDDMYSARSGVREIALGVPEGIVVDGDRVTVMCNGGLDEGISGHQEPGVECTEMKVAKR